MDIRGEDVKTAEPEQLIEAYSGFVAKIAARYAQMIKDTGAIDIDDLRQEGNIALLSARDTYNPAEDISFSTWAAGYIKNRIRRAIGYKTDGTMKEQPALILDAPPPGLESPDGVSLIDTLPSDDEPPEALVMLSEEREEVRKAVDRIQNQTQKEIIKSVFFQGKGYKETAEEMNTTVDFIRGKKESALTTLRRDYRLKRYILPNLRIGSLSFFRFTGSTIEEEAILRQEKDFDLKYGEGSFVEKMISEREEKETEIE